MTDSPLSQPLYGASFGQAVQRFFRKYTTFSGRASLSEFWWSYLFFVAALFVLSLFAGPIAAFGTAPTSSGGRGLTVLGLIAIVLLALVVIALLIPRVAVTVRRLHDANYSGWMLLLVLIPSIGGLIVLILNILPSNPEGARFDR
ncbi:DUF805 domain-containing protein [Schumannella luteola]